MTQFALPNNSLDFNANTSPTDNYSFDEDGTMSMDYSHELEPADQLQDMENLEGQVMMQEQDGVLYAYGDADGSGTGSQLYVISQVLDEDTGQVVNVAIPVDPSSLAAIAEDGSTIAIPSGNDIAEYEGVAAAHVNDQPTDEIAPYPTVDKPDPEWQQQEQNEVFHANAELSCNNSSSSTTQLQSEVFELNPTGSSRYEVESETEGETEITIKEVVEDDDMASEATTTTEFQIMQNGNRVVVRNSEGIIVHEFPLNADNRNGTTEDSTDTPPCETSTSGGQSFPVCTASAKNTKKKAKKEKPCAPVKGKRIHPDHFDMGVAVPNHGTADRVLTITPPIIPGLGHDLPPKAKVVVTKLDNQTECDTDTDLSDKLNLPFCYSGESFNLQSQKLIMNVYHFFKKVHKGELPSPDTKSPSERAAAALNVSHSVISRVKKRFNEGDCSKDSTARQKKNGLKSVVEALTEDDEQVLRNMIEDSAKQGITGVAALFEAAKEKIGFKGSRSSFRRILEKIGFKYSKIDKKTALRSMAIEESEESQSTSTPITFDSKFKCESSSSGFHSANSSFTSIPAYSPDGANYNTSNISNDVHRDPPLINFYWGSLDAIPKREPIKKVYKAKKKAKASQIAPDDNDNAHVQNSL